MFSKLPRKKTTSIRSVSSLEAKSPSKSLDFPRFPWWTWRKTYWPWERPLRGSCSTKSFKSHLGLAKFRLWKKKWQSLWKYTYLEPVCPLFWGFSPPKEGPLQSKQGSFGFQIYIESFGNPSYLVFQTPTFSATTLQQQTTGKIRRGERKRGERGSLLPCVGHWLQGARDVFTLIFGHIFPENYHNQPKAGPEPIVINGVKL